MPNRDLNKSIALGEQFTIMAGALALTQFTARELREATEVNPYTVNSWIQRNAKAGRYVEKAPDQPTRYGGRGRPPIVYRLRQADIEDLRAQVAQLSAMADAQGDVFTAEEAEEAFADTEIRDTIEYYLRQATRSEDRSERTALLGKAHDLHVHETERLQEWADAGHAVPIILTRKLKDCSKHLKGLEIYVDQIGFDRKLRSIDDFADWLARGIDNWCAPTGIQPAGFSPLNFAIPDSGDRRTSLADNLMVLLETAEHVGTVPRDHLLSALLMALPRVSEADAYQAICDAFRASGHDAIGHALENRLRYAHDDLCLHRFIHHSLTGLMEYPELLQNPRIGAWVRGLLANRFDPGGAIVRILMCLERLNSGYQRIIGERQSEIERVIARIDTPDDNWRKVNSGIEARQNAQREAAERYLQELSLRTAGERDEATSGMVGTFLGFFAPTQAETGLVV